MRFIGDTHGKDDAYLSVIKDCEKSIQVGDFGIGFPEGNPYKAERIANKLAKGMGSGNRFIRGNHDNPDACKNHANYISDGTLETLPNGKKIMYIGGALSIDGPDFMPGYRTEGKNWWADEELSDKDLSLLVGTYFTHKPDIMITHECPEQIAQHIFARTMIKDKYYSRTRRAFDVMLNEHRPSLWVFGHWHQNKDINSFGTRFICLDELSYIDIDFSDLDVGTIQPYGRP